MTAETDLRPSITTLTSRPLGWLTQLRARGLILAGESNGQAAFWIGE